MYIFQLHNIFQLVCNFRIVLFTFKVNSVVSKFWHTCNFELPLALRAGPLAQWCPCGTPRPDRAANRGAGAPQCGELENAVPVQRLAHNAVPVQLHALPKACSGGSALARALLR